MIEKLDILREGNKEKDERKERAKKDKYFIHAYQ